MADSRAVVFDLDDTLYPRRSFVLSGFRAVAEALERDCGQSADGVFHALQQALDNGANGREIQAVCRQLDLPESIVPELVEVIRSHAPGIELPAGSARVLRDLKPSWRIGILTNGLPPVQRRKATALGLPPLVDAIVCAAEHGDGAGKPAPEGFLAVLDALGVEPAMAVFVGDDVIADLAGAAAVGMKTMHVSLDERATRSPAWRLSDVPQVAAGLVRNRRSARVL